MERKEAIEVIKKNWPDSSFTMLREALETLVPELKESEDENIRKRIIHALRGDVLDMEETTKAIAWLEKQDEQIDFANKEYWRGYHEGKLEILDKYADLEKQSKQKIADKYDIREIKSKHAEGKLGEMIKNLKSADKVEPKFHKGEWITNGDYTWKIVEVKPLDYILQSQDGNIVDDTISHVDEQFHSFTIDDANDGDVLYSPCLSLLWIFKSRGSVYCGYNLNYNDGTFCGEGYFQGPSDAIPATKEQREQLEKAMADAGYTFDFEKKELKKLGQPEVTNTSDQEAKPNGGIVYEDFNEGDGSYKVNLAYLSKPQVEFIEDLVDSWKNTTNNTVEWSAEDEAGLSDALWAIKQARTIAKDENDMGNLWYAERWLKSLRPHKQWKPSEEQIATIEYIIKGYESTTIHLYDGAAKQLYLLLEQLKKLK